MFPQFKKINNESGIVLFIVLMVSIIIMIFSLGILTQTINENNFAQQQIDQIAAQDLAKGIFWNAYSNGTMSTIPAKGKIFAFSEDGRDYIANIYLNGTDTEPGVNSYNVVANYDTFQ